MLNTPFPAPHFLCRGAQRAGHVCWGLLLEAGCSVPPLSKAGSVSMTLRMCKKQYRQNRAEPGGEWGVTPSKPCFSEAQPFNCCCQEGVPLLLGANMKLEVTRIGPAG